MQPFGKAWWAGIATGTVLTIMVIAPRTATAMMLLVLLVAGAEHLYRRGLPRVPSSFEFAFLSVVAFAVWAMVSALWSPQPMHSLLKPVFLILATTGVWLAIRMLSTATRPFSHYFGEGALTGIIVGYVLVCIEVLSDQVITRSILSLSPSFHENISKHVTVDDDGTVTSVTIANLNRRMAILAWLFWPALLLALHDPNRIRSLIGYAVVIVGGAIILFLGSHQSSQMALVGGALAFAAAYYAPHLTRRALGVIWAGAVLLAVPLALAMHFSGLHEADWLFKSAKHRVIIWGTTAEEVMKSPLLGVGADATRKAMRKATDAEEGSGGKAQRQAAAAAVNADGADQPGQAAERPADRTDKAKKAKKLSRAEIRQRKAQQFESGYANHAHNVYLQVWYEVGAVGAVLFLIVGLTALQAIGRLEVALQPAACAMFATTALLIAFSYSIWQTWFISALAMGVIVLAAAIRKRSDRLSKPEAAGEASPSRAVTELV